MPITPQLTAASVSPGACYPPNLQALLNTVAQNLIVTGLDSSTFFSYGPSTPPTDAQGMPWVKTDAQYGFLGIYTFAGGSWQSQALPFTTGDIMMFNGPASSIVDPWFVCDGISNARGVTTPDLQGSFIIGTGTRTLPTGSTDTANNYTLGLQGGRETTVITPQNLPAHGHLAAASSLVGSFSPDARFSIFDSLVPVADGMGGLVGGGNTTGISSDGMTFNPPVPTPTLPPFYALAFKMYIAPVFP